VVTLNVRLDVRRREACSLFRDRQLFGSSGGPTAATPQLPYPESIVRPSICELTLVLLVVTTAPEAGRAQTAPRLQPADRLRLAEGKRLADRLCEQVWPGWGRTPFQLLLLGDSAEFLVGGPPKPDGFTRVGYDAILGTEIWTRPQRFPPTLLATFPAVGGIPTIVVGSAERTGKSSMAWVLTLMHEHFHQWQYSQPDYYAGVARLGLAHGDSTGQWMLNYPFPYSSPAVQQSTRELAIAVRKALDSDSARRQPALAEVVRARNALQSRLSPEEYRYLEFQLWQEGVARFLENVSAIEAAKLPPPHPEFQRLRDYETYSRVAQRVRQDLRQALQQLDLGQQGRVAFYPLGAGIALLLDETRPDWKQEYTRHPFALAALIPAD
jgi:hypothetical protein